MKYKIVLKVRSPLIAGGKKLGNDYIKSLDYIPGSVLRAAISREITQSCPYYNHKESNKKYWVSFRNEDECKNCKFKNLCRDFSDIKIGHCYPFGGCTYPLTAMRCKAHPEHKAFDTLAAKLQRKLSSENKGYSAEFNPLNCPECHGRAERCDGLYYEDNNTVRDIEAVYGIITKNSINPHLNISKEGVLYSLDALTEEVLVDGNEKELRMEGIIEGSDLEEDLGALDTLFIGAYTTAGFGEVKTSFEVYKEKEDISEIKGRVNAFNNKLHYKDKYLIPITLKTDTYLNIEKIPGKYQYELSTEDYVNYYNKLLKPYIPFSADIFSIIASNEMRRGFDTSNRNVLLRKPRVVTKAGSIFVLEAEKENLDYKKLLQLEQEGIGENTAHGFGRIRITDNFHIK